MQALVRTLDLHEPETIRSPLLKPSYRTCLQVAGLQELATTPGIYKSENILYGRNRYRSHRSLCQLGFCTGRFGLFQAMRAVASTFLRNRAENGTVQNGNHTDFLWQTTLKYTGPCVATLTNLQFKCIGIKKEYNKAYKQ